MGDRIRRSWLIVPAHDEARLEEAAHAGADVIVLDLQDTVHDTKKHVARARIRETIPRLCTQGAEVFVRADIELLYADLHASVWRGLSGVMLPGVTSVAQVQEADSVLGALQAERGTSLVLITHDLGVVAEMAHRVAVMYGGQIVEDAPVEALFGDPKHPYTRGLLGSIPVIGVRHDQLTVIPGRVPTLVDPVPGCRFADRCPERMERCTQATPLRDTAQAVPNTCRSRTSIQAGHPGFRFAQSGLLAASIVARVPPRPNHLRS